MKVKHLPLFVCLAVIGCTTSEVAQKTAQSSNESKVQATVIEPLGFSTDANSYAVSATQSDTIFTPAGSTILFQPNSFVDANGKPVKGKVDVAWQEFHTLGDIVASGIPMKYDSSGVAYDLESGGMFTINATHKGKEVQLAPGKEAEVNLASIQDTPCYNFYKLDEKSGQWDYKTTDSGVKVDAKAAEKTKGEPEKKTILDMELSLKDFPELQKKDIIGWQTTKNLTRAERSWIESSGTQVRLTERNSDNHYVLEVKDKKASLKIPVDPYFEAQAISDSKINARALDKSADEISEYQRKVADGRSIRSIKINGFGTYNWDIINKRANSLPLFASFEYPNGTNAELVTLRLISPDENVVVSYNAKGDPQFSFDPGKRNLLIGILPNNEIVAASNNAFDAARTKKKGAPHTFVLKKTGLKLKKPEDIMKFMNQLI